MTNLFHKKFIMLYLGLWVFSYNIYPAWVLPLGSWRRVSVFFIFLFYLLLNIPLAKKCLRDKGFSAGHSQDSVKNTPLMAAFTAFFILLQLYPLTLPVQVLGDEAYHLYVPARLFSLFLPFLTLARIAAFLLLSALLVILIKRPGFVENTFKKIRLSGYFIAIFLFSLFTLCLFKAMPFSPGLVRYPPLGKVIYLLTFMLTGINESAVRAVEMLFTVSAAFYLYRIVRLYKERNEALLAFVIFLFSPVVFYYAHLAYLMGGVSFFTLGSLYYLLRYSKSAKGTDVLLMVLFLEAGFFYKETMIVLVPFYLLILFLFLLARDKGKGAGLLLCSKVLYLALAPLLPWMFIHKFFIWRHYELAAGNWFLPQKALFLFLAIRECLTLPLFIFFVLSLVYLLMKKRDFLDLSCVIIAAVLYIFWTSDSWLTEMSLRNILTLMPFVAIFTGSFIMFLLRIIKMQKAAIVTSSILAIYLGLSSTIMPGLGQSEVLASYVYHKNTQVDNPGLIAYYLPYDGLFSYLRDNMDMAQARILYPNIYAPVTFYNYKYGLANYWEQEPGKRFASAKELADFAAAQGFSYLVLDNGSALAGFYGQLQGQGGLGTLLLKEFSFGKGKLAFYRLKNGAR